MFLSNRDIRWAIQCQQLIVDPAPETFGRGYDETSIDLHLDDVNEAKIWDVDGFAANAASRGARGPELHLGHFNYGRFSEQYLIDPPEEAREDAAREKQLVFRRARLVIVKPSGFLLWTTKERIGTPTVNPRLISFVNAKSTRARTGLVVHMTAPTIHAGWEGKITLEIANHGPFHFVLEENDVIAQLTCGDNQQYARPRSQTGAVADHWTTTCDRSQLNSRLANTPPLSFVEAQQVFPGSYPLPVASSRRSAVDDCPDHPLRPRTHRCPRPHLPSRRRVARRRRR